MSISGDRIREFRTRLSLTLDDVARHLSVGRQTIYKYEHGTVTNIPLENLEKMAALFGTNPGYLSGWNNDPSPFLDVQDKDLSEYIRLLNEMKRKDLDALYAISSDEQHLIDSYRSLTVRGQQLLRDRMEELRLLYGKKPEGPSAKSV